MLSIIHRYVLWELVRSFIISFAALVGMMLLGALYRPLRLGVSLEDLASLIPYMLPHLYAWVIPAAALSACVMSYGRLSADNEITALCTSGVPLRYICYPALVLGLVLTSLAMPLNDTLVPHCMILKDRELRRIFYREPFRVSLLGREITTSIGGSKIYVEAVDGNILRNVVVIEPKKEEDTSREDRKKKRETPSPAATTKAGTDDEASSEVNVYRAERARYTFDKDRRKIRIVLEHAQVVMVLPGRSARQWIEISADEQVKEIAVADTEVSFEKRGNTTTAQLLARVAARRLELATGRGAKRSLEREIVHLLTEVRLREALAFSVLALCFVGVPIGVWMRRQSRLASFAVGILVFMLLYAMIVGGEGLSLEQRLPPWLALWTPDALMAGLGLALLMRLFRH
ncbi:MAG TPA: LptF/LptG family permease [Planctomycetota bacterium]|nr:LptF/LptG family permease [Planctomycetota bacterium]HRT97633.1 LptF/LptG family permease [Planctomycetota bacterium]